MYDNVYKYLKREEAKIKEALYVNNQMEVVSVERVVEHCKKIVELSDREKRMLSISLARSEARMEIYENKKELPEKHLRKLAGMYMMVEEFIRAEDEMDELKFNLPIAI